ncbi:MAG: NIPSNAP family protein [bacterium]|jgi:hypothetical protein|nr:NIPSNAP family protein [bacterium]
MKRRDFVTATAAFAAMGTALKAESAPAPARQYLELRKYQTLYGDNKGILDRFLAEAAIPAWNRQGIEPVGAFSVKYGESDPTVYVLLPHPSMESVVTSTRAMLEDDEFLKKGADFLDVSSSDANFFRMENSLMLTFTGMPTLEIPEAVKGKDGRIFEMRIYESHSEKKAKKKIEMFNEGGEIEIFRKTGLYPVFFGEAIIGPRLPNLTYMLGFESMEQRDANWKTFVNSPEWKELSPKEEYKDTVCNISDIILSPKSYSQI